MRNTFTSQSAPKGCSLLLAAATALLLLLLPYRTASGQPLPPSAALSAVAGRQVKAADTAPTIRITIDDTAVRQLLALMEAGDAADASVEKWLDLPANQNLLRVGALEDNLTRAQLKANAVAVIRGTATSGSQREGEIGRLLLTPPGDYRRMLDDLKATSGERVDRIARRVAAFSPPATEAAVTVYLHPGGNWDAINYKNDIYLNIHFWHDYHKPGWDGLNMIIAHETMHTVQNRAYGNPEEQDDSEGAWLTALSKIQREGTARYVEVDTDPERYEPYSYGFHYRAISAEGLRAFERTPALLQRLHAACFPALDKPRFVAAYTQGIENGGPYYTLGHGIAKAIDEKLGRAALIETVRRGPRDFFTKYIALCAKDPSLPPLPPPVIEQITRMKERL